MKILTSKILILVFGSLSSRVHNKERREYWMCWQALLFLGHCHYLILLVTLSIALSHSGWHLPQRDVWKQTHTFWWQGLWRTDDMTIVISTPGTTVGVRHSHIIFIMEYWPKHHKLGKATTPPPPPHPCYSILSHNTSCLSKNIMLKAAKEKEHNILFFLGHPSWQLSKKALPIIYQPSHSNKSICYH